jgi:autotransporter-associated beta strand protein
LSTSRTITLDGAKTAGKLLFDSPFSYTISPGTGGQLTLDNAGSAATLTSNQGNHTIGVDVQLASHLTAAVNAGTLTISGAVTGAGGLTKTGAGRLTLTAPASYSGPTTVSGGTLQAAGNLGSLGGPVTIGPGARLEISGSIPRSIVNNGVIAGPGSPAAFALDKPVTGAGAYSGNVIFTDSFAPGAGPAAVSLENVNFGSEALLSLEVGGAAPGTQYDKLAVANRAGLGGSLEVAFTGGFVPSAGQSFTLLAANQVFGEFSSVALPFVPYRVLELEYSPTSVVLTVAAPPAGDYNFDVIVDGGDLLVWQRTFGSKDDLFADGDASGEVDAADLDIWANNFGATATFVANQVPEPGGWALLTLVFGIIGRRGRTPRP